VSAQENISAVVGKNADFSVVKRFTVAAGELVSIFAQKMGLKLFAAKGPVEVQAQTDAMTLASDKDMTITSVNGKVTVAAAKELILECDGAFVQLKDGNITLGGPADLFFKVITIQKQGQASQNTPMPALPYPAPGATDLEFRRIYADGSPVAGCQYIATLDDGTTRSGTLNAEGYVRLTGLPTGMGARIRYLDDPNPHKASITAEHDSDMNDVMPQNNEGEQA
jgi:type VI secretion system secreted protein VgrG